MALNDNTDRQISRNGRYETAREIEMRNYMETIFRLGEKDPSVLYRIIDLAREKEKDSQSCPKCLKV